jgi:CelD/BcsL family acetyltransferase involved in cellulose biosynthesis
VVTESRVLTTTSHPWTAWPQLEAGWTELALASPHTSFFLTPDWIGAWLAAFGAERRARVLVFHDAASTVGMCLLASRREQRGPFTVRRLLLHTAGEDPADETVIEYNALVCLGGREPQMAAALRRDLEGQAWDEFVADGMAEGPCLQALLSSAFPDIPASVVEVQSHYVDLARLGPGPDSALPGLSANTREQLRRSTRIYEREGRLRVEAAADVPEALAMLDELAQLHQSRWTARGKPGVFASPRFTAFHRALVARAFPSGGIQLLRIRAGETVIGLLYNFVYKGRVYFYQGGLRFSDDNRLKPGLVAHAAAIRYGRDAGLREYDFLGGDDRYKQSLSTDARTLRWLVFERPTLKMKALRLLRRLKRRKEGRA